MFAPKSLQQNVPNAMSLHMKGAILKNVEENYKMLEKVGEGTFSKVYRGEHLRTHKIFAIKHVSKKGLIDGKAITRLRDEISFLQECIHPHIIKFYEFYISDSFISIVTEYCEGGDLFDMIMEHSPFPEPKAASIYRQIILAVSFLHDRGITHRDLKPENILFRTKQANSPIVLADFGFAKRTEGRSALMHSDVGTPDYAAPEILAMRYTNSVDMWACGCILYCLLNGLPPFYSDSSAETLRKITNGDPIEFYEDTPISKEGMNLILSLLDRNPQSRLSAAAVLKHPWLTKYGEKSPQPAVEQVKRVGSEASRSFLRNSLNLIVDQECKDTSEFKTQF